MTSQAYEEIFGFGDDPESKEMFDVLGSRRNGLPLLKKHLDNVVTTINATNFTPDGWTKFKNLLAQDQFAFGFFIFTDRPTIGLDRSRLGDDYRNYVIAHFAVENVWGLSGEDRELPSVWDLFD